MEIAVFCLYTVYAVLQEGVSTGDPELVQLVLQYRDFRRATERLAGIPELLSKLRQVKLTHSAARIQGLSLDAIIVTILCVVSQAQDFYVEMKWEFTSWGKF